MSNLSLSEGSGATTSFTVTSQDKDLDASPMETVAVIAALPVPSAVTVTLFPLPPIDATESLLLLHDTSETESA